MKGWKKMKHLKSWLAGVLAALLLITFAFTGVMAEMSGPVQEAVPESGFSIQTEEALRNQAGMDTRAWDEAAAWQKEVGLQSPITQEELSNGNPDVRILSENGRIWMIDGAEAVGAVSSPMEAYRAVYRLTGLLGAARDAELRLWSVVTMPQGRKAYIFQQVYEGLTVLASTVKLVTGQDGRVMTVISSLSSGKPESTGVQEITAGQAEDIVRKKLTEQGFDDSILPEYTARAILPMETDDETDGDENLPDRLVWIVYSHNPRFADSATVDLPYLAHCVGLDGEYLHVSEVTFPAISSTQGGYPAEYAFEFMEKGEWSGTVHGHGKTTMELTVPVMRDSRTDVWYLGDAERKIAVGDFAALAYGDEKVKLISGPENSGWDEEALITYWHLIRAWDFYADLGWYGPDGSGTPVLLLKDLCLENGESIENAAYLGLEQGWQCFGYGSGAYLGQGLDVMAHEFTHGVTTALMNTNLYQNDYGAINEALSDILGNLCEQMSGDEDDNWLLGEDTGSPFRSMLDPHLFGQPEYVWDIYYGPHTDAPNSLNDRGGVHANSSILNLVAARLCAEYGMPLDTARTLWMTVACGLTPRMDYPQTAELIRWAVRISGCEAYQDAADTLIAETRMAETGLPETLPEGQRLVRLTLPDSGDIADSRWVLWALQVDLPSIQARLGELAALLGSAWNALWGGEAEQEQLEARMDELKEQWHWDELSRALEAEDDDTVSLLMARKLNGYASEHITWRAGDSNDAVMVLRDLPTLYLLMNMNEDDLSMQGLAVMIGGRWFDLAALVNPEGAADEASEKLLMEASEALVNELLNLILNPAKEEPASDTRDLPAVTDLPTEGLENLRLILPAPAEEPAPEDSPLEDSIPAEEVMP